MNFQDRLIIPHFSESVKGRNEPILRGGVYGIMAEQIIPHNRKSVKGEHLFYCEIYHKMRIAKQRLCKNSQIRVAKGMKSPKMRIANRKICKNCLYNEGN